MKMASSLHNTTTSRTASCKADGLGGGSPIDPPDISKCKPVQLAPEVQAHCCLPIPKDKKIIDFKLPPSSLPMRKRPAAHLVDKDYTAKYEKAIKLMKALSADDPRNFMQQAEVHCAFCNGAYDQAGFPNLELQVHGSWLFFPWHRCFLYFFERIICKLLDDDTFALPFWNWDSPSGMVLPSIYTDPSSPLYDERRNGHHQPPVLVDLNYASPHHNDTQQQRKDVIARNLATMYKQVVSGGKTAKLFMGHPYRKGDRPCPGAGSLEKVPHNTVHNWTGDPTQPFNADMGHFYSAGQDPIFYAHHCNIDRLWEVWRTLGGNRRNFTCSSWLDTAFLFYNENAQLVRIRIRDCLEPCMLRYTYQKVDMPWLPPYRPSAMRTRGLKAKAPKNEVGKTNFPRKLDSVVRAKVRRPKKSRSRKEKENEEEVLVIDGVELKPVVAVKFDVYINLDEEEASRAGPQASEHVGSFVNVPHGHANKPMKTSLMLGITDALEDLGADDDDEVVVTIVPRQGMDVVSVGGLTIEFSS